MKKKLLSLFFALLFCFCVFPTGGARAAGDAMNTAQVKSLLNGTALYPQRTGYAEMDALLQKLLAPYESSDNYTKLKIMYDWAVKNIQYNWEGYSQDWAPAYDKFTLTYKLTYETGLPEAMPKEAVYRSYHSLTAKKGVCYDWAALFAIMARYIGFESYIRTGYFQLESFAGGGTCHHGWTVLRIDGQDYIFDAQRDFRVMERNAGRNLFEYFGIPKTGAWRYRPDGANAKRDKGFLPVTTERVRTATVTVRASESGKVNGAGKHNWGEEITLCSAGDVPVAKWYSETGKLLHEGPEYNVILDRDLKLSALFEGDYFLDVISKSWYYPAVRYIVENQIMSGFGNGTFQPAGEVDRAQLVQTLYNLEGKPATEATDTFTDVKPDAWYKDAVDWAAKVGVTSGTGDGGFSPNQSITREQLVTMLYNYAKVIGMDTTASAGLDRFPDGGQVHEWATAPMQWAVAKGFINGREEGSKNYIAPQGTATRAEVATVLVKFTESL